MLFSFFIPHIKFDLFSTCTFILTALSSFQKCGWRQILAQNWFFTLHEIKRAVQAQNSHSSEILIAFLSFSDTIYSPAGQLSLSQIKSESYRNHLCQCYLPEILPDKWYIYLLTLVIAPSDSPDVSKCWVWLS